MKLPCKRNSNNVFKFSGVGAVTKILEKPAAIAPAMIMPIAADLP